MGNSNSQATSLATSVVVNGGVGGAQGHRLHQIGEHGWVQSYPRTSQRLNVLGATGSRVLPQVATPPRLRATNNGEILYNGGTISGRQHQQPQRDRHPRRGRSMPTSAGSGSGRPSPADSKISARRRTTDESNVSSSDDAASRLKRYGSVPDMRYDGQANDAANHEQCQERKSVGPMTAAAAAAAAARKKYKAPQPPAVTADRNGMNSERETSDFPPSSVLAAAAAATRRARLFKTRAEMNKKRPPAPAPPLETTQCDRRESFQIRRISTNTTEVVTPTANQPRMLADMGRSKSLPEFQAELRAITARLRRDKALIQQEQESNKPQQQVEPQPPTATTTTTKTFYFYGMAEGDGGSKEKTVVNVAYNSTENDTTTNQAGPVVGSPVDNFLDIAPNLRPVLPKKQYEVPRFSPAAAWRQLAMLDADRKNDQQIKPRPNFDFEMQADVEEDDEDSGDDFDDGEREERTNCEPSPSYPLNDTRTAVAATAANVVGSTPACDDSGISGDGDISPITNVERRPRRRRRTHAEQGTQPEQAVLSWTPEQDLDGEDDSNSEDNFNARCNAEDVDLAGEDYEISRVPPINCSGAVVTTRFAMRTGHVFSLSLPRDNRLQNTNTKQEFTRQQHKATVVQTTNNTTTTTTSMDQSDNWFFSRSAPNSLNNGPTSLEHHNLHHNESGRVMYLPPAPSTKRGVSVERQREQQDVRRHRSQQRDPIGTTIKQTRSCENLSIRPNQPQNLQDTPTTETFLPRVADNEKDRNTKRQPQQQRNPPNNTPTTGNGRKTRRFTFQSTVRQIERRRLAERLSREAERKERQRLNELAAMQRVEEEFQRKRAREKANIRQQLMLYNRSEGGDEYVDDEEDEHMRSSLHQSGPTVERARPEPDGCCDGDGIEESRIIHADPPPATQVLSEYRLPRREYMEWQSGHGSSSSPVAATLNGGGSDTPSATGVAALNTGSVATVHPKIVCDMPRATQQQQRQHDHGNNYRRSFAHGGRSHANPVAS